MIECSECSSPATWVRQTQFSGDHYFCTEHAQTEKDFGKTDPSYYIWKEVDPRLDLTVKTTVEDHTEMLEELAYLRFFHEQAAPTLPKGVNAAKGTVYSFAEVINITFTQKTGLEVPPRYRVSKT